MVSAEAALAHAGRAGLRVAQWSGPFGERGPRCAGSHAFVRLPETVHGCTVGERVYGGAVRAASVARGIGGLGGGAEGRAQRGFLVPGAVGLRPMGRSEEHTSELQSLRHLV